MSVHGFLYPSKCATSMIPITNEILNYNYNSDTGNTIEGRIHHPTLSELCPELVEGLRMIA
jgi:hypothetical protein